MRGLTGIPTPPTAIISYSYDSEQHKERVLQLAQELRARGIDCLLDRFVDPTDWPLWMESRIRKSDWVLVVATEAYLALSRNEAEPGSGLGASWEYACIRAEIHAARGETRKFLPIVFHARDSAFVPDALRRRTLYNVKNSSDLNRLINKMRGIPDTVKAAPLGPVTNLRIVSNGIEPRPELGASTGFRAINARKRLFVLHQRHDDEMSDAAFFSRWEDQKAARRWDDPAIASLRARYGESFDGKTDSALPLRSPL